MGWCFASGRKLLYYTDIVSDHNTTFSIQEKAHLSTILSLDLFTAYKSIGCHFRWLGVNCFAPEPMTTSKQAKIQYLDRNKKT
ncbi:MAG: hypothetical protein CM15mP58_23120 [Burkholderiaceae bacterium]|nr:MAG: hypothetical protein CM15mP58_23120 [Burkholderiaceae bacterium]